AVLVDESLQNDAQFLIGKRERNGRAVANVDILERHQIQSNVCVCLPGQALHRSRERHIVDIDAHWLGKGGPQLLVTGNVVGISPPPMLPQGSQEPSDLAVQRGSMGGGLIPTTFPVTSN